MEEEKPRTLTNNFNVNKHQIKKQTKAIAKFIPCSIKYKAFGIIFLAYLKLI